MIRCKHCKKMIEVSNPLDYEVPMFRHMKDEHPEKFKAESHKILKDFYADNFNIRRR